MVDTTTVSLRAALASLVDQCLLAPPEVLRKFPAWRTDVMQTVCELPPSQLALAITSLEENLTSARSSDEAIACAFARSTLQTAVDCHEYYGGVNRAQSSGTFAGDLWVAPSAFESALASGRALQMGGGDGGDLVRRLLAEAPPAVQYTFGDFGSELKAAAARPLPALRAAAARLEAAHRDVAGKLFTEECLEPAAAMPAHRIAEAHALAFAVRAMGTLVRARAAVAIADAAADAAAAERRRGSWRHHQPATTTPQGPNLLLQQPFGSLMPPMGLASPAVDPAATLNGRAMNDGASGGSEGEAGGGDGGSDGGASARDLPQRNTSLPPPAAIAAIASATASDRKSTR